MGYTISLLPGWIAILRLTPPVTEEEVPELMADIQKKVDEWPRVGMLVDVSQIGTIPRPVAKAFADQVQNFPDPKPNRSALVGANAAMRVLGGFYLQLIPKYRDSRFFETEKEGLDWLREPGWGPADHSPPAAGARHKR